MSLLSNLLDESQREGRRAEILGPVLTIDVGNVYTRAALFDIVDGIYRFVARGEAPTTAVAPWNDVMEGVDQVIKQITEATGRQFVDENGELITGRDPFNGVSQVAVTASAGKPTRAVLVGMMPEVSLISGKRAAESTYLLLVDTFSLADKRSPEQKINALFKALPELILIVGGTDSGASRSIKQQVETIALACSLMEREHRPTILYSGNRAIQAEIQDMFEEAGVRCIVADNVRPSLDNEDLDSAQQSLAELYHRQRSHSTGGFADLGGWTDSGIYPTAHGFSRMVNILGKLDNQNVLGVDLASSDTTIAAQLRGHHYLNVEDGVGMGHTAKGILKNIRLENLTRWLSYEPTSPDDILNYIWNKWLFPHTIPANIDELEIEYALAREVIRYGVLSARTGWRNVRQRGPLPPFDTILMTGATLCQPPNYGWTVMVALDALLPIGPTRLLIDPYSIASALGTIAPQNPRAVVQVLDTGAFTDLGTAISISGRSRVGDIVLRGVIKPQGESKGETFEVTYGSIVTLDLPYGKEAEITLQPRNVDVLSGLGKPLRRLKVSGGELGVIIDARGRPWRFSRDSDERRRLLRQWQHTMTGREQEV
jgi:uncharacterized protein (TIGR01319 family)